MHPTLVGRVLMLINGLTNLSAHAHLMGHSLIRTMPDKRGRGGGGGGGGSENPSFGRTSSVVNGS
jgi:hypothetical protein